MVILYFQGNINNKKYLFIKKTQFPKISDQSLFIKSLVKKKSEDNNLEDIINK